jgi:large subunit ribosomal protein L30
MSTPKHPDAKPIKVTLVRSLLGRQDKQCRVIRALGLKKMNSHVMQYDTPTIRGMIKKVVHLVSVEAVVV